MAPLAALAMAVECAQCHPKQSKAHAATLMAQTLEAGSTARILKRHPRLQYALGPYRYTIEKGRYRVTDGSAIIDAPIHWAMGQGEAGQTYIIEVNGQVYESRVSFYDALGGLAPTMGAPAAEPKSLLEAAGRELVPKAVTECFGCHSLPRSPPAAGVARGTLEWTRSLAAGVQCENCHVGASKHAANVAVRPVSLAKVSTEELSEVCGKCHRTWADIAANGPRGVSNVRFQPYRIARSKCYDAVDRRIGCTSCHDPHDRPSRAVAVAQTDRACASCHVRFCKVRANKRDCASCHMPKYELPGAHFKFTDHWIRNPMRGYPD